MLTVTPNEYAFKTVLMKYLDPIDVLTCDFALTGFCNNTERLNRTNINLKDMVNQTVMEKVVKDLNLTYKNPTNITLVTQEAMDAMTSQSVKNTLTALLPSIPGLGYLLSFLG